MRRLVTLAGPWTVLAMTGCSGAQSVLDPAGDQAASIATLWNLMLWVCGFMYALVLGFLAAALWKARGAITAEIGAHESGMRRALGGWTALIVAGLLVLIGASFVLDRQLAQADLKNALRVKITAAQWWWRVEYEDPVPANRITTANELYLPIDRPIHLELHAEDVIHSFWVPNLAGKKDLIPGRVNTLTFTPTRLGTYRGQCAEFCGLQHSHMAIDAVILSAAQFTQWQRRQLAPAPAPATPQQVEGLRIFTQGACTACHQIIGTDAAGQTGPNLTHLASRRMLAAGARAYSRDALREWLADPQAVKPGNHMPQVRLSPHDVSALVAYLDTLK